MQVNKKVKDNSLIVETAVIDGKTYKAKFSRTFGTWILKCNGLAQHGLTIKEFMSEQGFRKFYKMPKGVPLPNRAERKNQLNNLLETECWYDIEGKYKVTKVDVEQGSGPRVVHQPNLIMTWLSIRFMDNSHLCDWREFQQIKNDLCGKDREAVEIYPTEDRLVDEQNMFHLWVLPKGSQFPFGFMLPSTIDDNGTNREN